MNLRESMPQTAAFVDARRAEYGVEWVNRCIAEGHKHKRAGWFYAVEAGHVLGTPWPPADAVGQLATIAAAMGSGFICIVRPPSGGEGKA